jgi:hypothetical protein
MTERLGIYEGLDEQEYHADNALGSTDIKNLLNSPMVFWYNSKLNPKKQCNFKPAYKIGSAIHTAVLEPTEFSNRFSISRKHKACATSPTKLGRSEFSEVQLVKKEVKKLNAFEGQKREVSVFWVQNGVRCKARFDILDFGQIVIDLKTTRSVAKKDICNALFGPPLSYVIQAAHYITGLREVKKVKGITIGLERFKFLFITKTEPVEHLVAEIEEDIIEAYSERVSDALEIYKDSFKKWGVSKPWRNEDLKKCTFSLDDAPAWVHYY